MLSAEMMLLRAGDDVVMQPGVGPSATPADQLFMLRKSRSSGVRAVYTGGRAVYKLGAVSMLPPAVTLSATPADNLCIQLECTD